MPIWPACRSSSAFRFRPSCRRSTSFSKSIPISALPSTTTGPGDKVYPTPEVAYEKIKGLNKRLGLCIDVGHVARYGEDPVKAIKSCADRIFDMHLKDVSKAAADGHCCEAGRGVIDLPAVMKALIEIEFDGVASFEYEKDADDPLPGLAESVGYVRGILATL